MVNYKENPVCFYTLSPINSVSFEISYLNLKSKTSQYQLGIVLFVRKNMIFLLKINYCCHRGVLANAPVL